MALPFRQQPLADAVDRRSSGNGQDNGAAAPHAEDGSRLDELVVHDLLNPMTGVLGQLELLEDQLDQQLSDNDRQRLEECLSNARDLSEMLVNLRYLAQIQSGALPHRPMNVCAQRLLQSLQRDPGWSSDWTIELGTSVNQPPLYVQDNAALLSRAVQVLVHAAMRLSTSHRIVLDAEPAQDGRVWLYCRYVGRTLPGELKQMLGSPEIGSLQREHGIRVDRARGLELVHHIMQLLKGATHYEPTSDGGAFIITVPEAEAPASSQ